MNGNEIAACGMWVSIGFVAGVVLDRIKATSKPDIWYDIKEFALMGLFVIISFSIILLAIIGLGICLEFWLGQ